MVQGNRKRDYYSVALHLVTDHFYYEDSAIKNVNANFRPRWRRRQTHCASLHNRKNDNKFKNKKQAELTANWTIWKSDNQGVKEETFIQTGRRGGDWWLGREDLWQGSGWWTW